MDGIQAASNSILLNENDNGWDKALGCAVPFVTVTQFIVFVSLSVLLVIH